MAPRAIAKHVGILTGPNHFLHAYERLGVIEEPLTPSWQRRIAFAFLFPQLVSLVGLLALRPDANRDRFIGRHVIGVVGLRFPVHQVRLVDPEAHTPPR